MRCSVSSPPARGRSLPFFLPSRLREGLGVGQQHLHHTPRPLDKTNQIGYMPHPDREPARPASPSLFWPEASCTGPARPVWAAGFKAGLSSPTLGQAFTTPAPFSAQRRPAPAGARLVCEPPPGPGTDGMRSSRVRSCPIRPFANDAAYGVPPRSPLTGFRRRRTGRAISPLPGCRTDTRPNPTGAPANRQSTLCSRRPVLDTGLGFPSGAALERQPNPVSSTG